MCPALLCINKEAIVIHESSDKANGCRLRLTQMSGSCSVDREQCPVGLCCVEAVEQRVNIKSRLPCVREYNSTRHFVTRRAIMRAISRADRRVPLVCGSLKACASRISPSASRTSIATLESRVSIRRRQAEATFYSSMSAHSLHMSLKQSRSMSKGGV